MDPIVTTEGQREKIKFTIVLKHIHDHLESRDVKTMKFLCSDFISCGKMEKIRSSLDLFQELESLNLIRRPDDVALVAELLYCMKQFKLMQKLPQTKDLVAKAILEGRGRIHPVRILLHSVCEELTRDNFEKIRFICDDIPRSVKEKILDGHDLIWVLEKRNKVFVTTGNLEYLKNVLKEANLFELVEIVHQYELNSHLNRLGDLSLLSGTLNVGNQSPALCRTSLSDNMQGNQSAYVSTVSSGRGGSETNPGGNHLLGAETGGGTLQVNRSDDDDLPCYSMMRRPRGICLIINNSTFRNDDPNSEKLKDRKGSEIDCDSLQRLFSSKLHFVVKVLADQSDQEICHLMERWASFDHSEYDCFACFILSHGLAGAVFGANCKPVQIGTIISYFEPSKCLSLCSKPKLFFIQACQGRETQPANVATPDVVTDGPLSDLESDVGSSNVNVHEMADFLLALGTVPGYLSYLSKSQGTWYITTLVEMLEKYADKEDLVSILIEVNNKVSAKGVVCKQVPMPMVSLTKKIFFR